MDAAEGAPAPAEVRLLGGRYEVGEIIGRGGMGEVRAGVDRRLDRDVAIKLLRADMAHQPDVRRRFEDEARLAARLAHPHVVAVFDTGEEAGIPYLVMERLSGRTLADEIATGPLGCDEVRTTGGQILDALSAAHAAGLVHRDVKPGNVLLAGPGRWKVGDFGIAKSLDASDPTLTVAGLIVGTPAYLAPERLLGGPATVSSDLYATGVVLYEALAGRRPIDEDVPLATRPTARPTELTDLRPDVPQTLSSAVMRAIASEPVQRFATAADMAEALRSSTRGAPTAHTVRSAVPDATAATRVSIPIAQPTVVLRPIPSAATTGTVRASTHRRRDPRRRLGAIAVGVAAVLVVAIIAVALAVADHATSTASTPTTLSTATTPTNMAVSSPSGVAPGSPLDAALSRLAREVRP